MIARFRISVPLGVVLCAQETCAKTKTRTARRNLIAESAVTCVVSTRYKVQVATTSSTEQLFWECPSVVEGCTVKECCDSCLDGLQT